MFSAGSHAPFWNLGPSPARKLQLSGSGLGKWAEVGGRAFWQALLLSGLGPPTREGKFLRLQPVPLPSCWDTGPELPKDSGASVTALVCTACALTDAREG